MGFVRDGDNYQVAISLDGMWVFSKVAEKKLFVQNYLTGEDKRINARRDSKRESIRDVEMAAKSINGKWLILSFRDNTFTEWYLPETHKNLKTEWYLPETYKNLIKNQTSPAFLIRGVSSNNRWALRETKSGRLQVQNLFTGKVVHVLPKKYGNLDVSRSFWRKIAISNNGNFVFMPSVLENSSQPDAKNLVLWDLNNHPEIVPILQAYREELIYSDYSSNDSNVSTIAVSSDEQFCIVGFNNGVINIYELKSDRKVYSCQENKAPITCVAMSPDNQILISGTNNGIITVRNFQSQAAIDFKLDTVVNFKLDTEVAYCSFNSEKPIIIVGDIQEQIHLFQQVLSQHSSDESASPDEQSSTGVVSEQPTIISKRIRLQAMCGDDGYVIRGDAIGPGNLQIELYNQNRLIYQDSDFIPQGKKRGLFSRIPFPNEPWQEDLKGYIALQTPDNKFICKVDLTISCLITDLDVLKYYKNVADLTFDYGEAYLNKLLDLNERLFGPIHRKTEETIDRLLELNKTLNKDSEVELLQARKQEIKSSWRTETINIKYYENQKIFWYNCSYIVLNLRPEDVIESDSQDSTHSDVEKIDRNQAIDYRDSLGRELEEVWFLLQTLKEPGVNPLEYFGKAWKKFMSIVTMVMVGYKEQLQKFLSKLQEASIPNQLMLVLRNPRNLPHFAIARIFSSFFVIVFLISTIGKFSINNVSNWLGQNQILTNSLLIFWASCSIASCLVVIVLIPMYLGNYVTPDEEDVQRSWSNVILTKIINFLLISPFCLLGIIVGGVQGISLGMKGMEVITESFLEFIALINTHKYWFSIIATHCFSIFLATMTVLLGSWAEWIVRGKRKQDSPLSISDIAFLPVLTTLLGYQKYVSSVLWSLIWWRVFAKLFRNSETINYALRLLLGVSIGIGFSVLIGNYFGDNSFESLIVRAVSGAIIAIFIMSTSQPMMVGALGGLIVCVSVSFSFNSSLKPLIPIIKENTVLIGLILIKGIKLLLGGGIGLLLGGGIGFGVGMISGLCVILPMMIAFGAFWLFFQKITKDFQQRGYNSFFGVIFVISTALLGSILGMIPTILSIAK